MEEFLLPETPIPCNQLEEGFLFSATCREALEKIDEIVSMSMQTFQKNDNKEKDINNILSIVGERGSGKTTVLWSLQNIIENNSLSPVFVIRPLLEPRYFTDSNSLLQLVIAKLYFEFKRLSSLVDNTEDSMNISRLFEQLSNYFVFDGNKDTLADSLDALDLFSGLFDIRPSISELVSYMLKLENKENSNLKHVKNYTHFLFAIDDIDLDSKNAYKIICQLSKYLRCSNLIFILAYDQDTMNNVILCGKVKELIGAPFLLDYFDKEGSLTSDVRKLLKTSQDSYLEKIIPERYHILVHNGEEQKLIEGIWKLIEALSFYGKTIESASLRSSFRENTTLIFSVLQNCASLRHQNQSVNIYLSFEKKENLPDPFKRITVAAKSATYLLFGKSFEKTNKDNTLSTNFLSYLLTPRNIEANKTAVFGQIQAIVSFCSQTEFHYFVDFFLNTLVNHDSIYTQWFDPEKGFVHPKDISFLDPFSFFEMVSRISWFPLSGTQNEKLQNLANRNYYQLLMNYIGKSKNNDSEIVMKTKTKNLAEGNINVRQQIIEMLTKQCEDLRREKTKAVLKSIRETLLLALHYGLFSENDAQFVRTIENITVADKLKTIDPSFALACRNIYHLIFSLIHNVF